MIEIKKLTQDDFKTIVNCQIDSLNEGIKIHGLRAVLDFIKNTSLLEIYPIKLGSSVFRIDESRMSSCFEYFSKCEGLDIVKIVKN